MNLHNTPLSSLVPLLLITACLPEKPDTLVCGEGTHEEDGACVADPATGDDTGEPTGDDGGGEGGSEGGAESGEGGGEEGGGEAGGSDSDSGGGGEGGGDGGSEGGGDGGGADYDVLVCDEGGDYTSIQDAVDEAGRGDVIAVCAGTWDQVEIDNQELTLIGLDGSESTILEGTDAPALDADDSTITVTGFTIRGRYEGPSAVLLVDTDGAFDDIRISDNLVGQAVSLQGGTTTWENLVAEDNESRNSFFSLGSNYTTGSTYATIRHCLFQDNLFGDVGLALNGAHVELSNCAFVGNTSALQLLSASSGELMYNLVLYNNTTSNQFLVYVGTGATLTNSIFQENTTTLSMVYGFSTGTVSYTDFYNNVGTVGVGGSGNTSNNPRFVDAAAGDFTLDSVSPCIDAGDPSSLYNDVDGTTNDMGVFGGPFGSW